MSSGLLRPATVALVLALPLTPASAEIAPATTTEALAPAVTVIPATTREIVESIVVTGTLVPRDEILVTPEVDGYQITQVLVEEGSRVKRGQVLARLSRDLIDRSIAEQDALVAKATAAVPQAQSTIDEAEAARVEAQFAFDRAKTLASSGNTTAAVLETRTSALRQAEGRAAFAREGLAVAKADLAQAVAVRDELGLRLARTEIRAPEAGIVSRRTARVGMTASPSAEPLFRIIARGEVELEAEALDTDLPRIREDDPAVVDIGEGVSVAGNVRAVYPEVDKATRLGKLRVRLDPDPRLRAGAFARGMVEVARETGVTVPLAAVSHENGRATVLVVADGVVKSRAVQAGLADDRLVEIRSGLAPGDAVVARAGSFLRDGDRVRVMPPLSGTLPPNGLPAPSQAAAAP